MCLRKKHSSFAAAHSVDALALGHVGRNDSSPSTTHRLKRRPNELDACLSAPSRRWRSPPATRLVSRSPGYRYTRDATRFWPAYAPRVPSRRVRRVGLSIDEPGCSHLANSRLTVPTRLAPGTPVPPTELGWGGAGRGTPTRERDHPCLLMKTEVQ